MINNINMVLVFVSVLLLCISGIMSYITFISISEKYISLSSDNNSNIYDIDGTLESNNSMEEQLFDDFNDTKEEIKNE